MTSPSTTTKTAVSSLLGRWVRRTPRCLLFRRIPPRCPSSARRARSPERAPPWPASEIRGSSAPTLWPDGPLARVRRRKKTLGRRVRLAARGSERGKHGRRRWPPAGVRCRGAKPISGSLRVTIGVTGSVSAVLVLRPWFSMVRASGIANNVASKLSSNLCSFRSSFYF